MELKSKLLLVSAALAASFSVSAVQQKNFSAVLSPNKQEFTYYSYRGNELPDIYINSADGSQERNLTNSPNLWEIEPDWSDNGALIAYAGGENMGSMEIFTIAPDGSHKKQITDGEGSATGPNFSPDGKYIVFNRFYRDSGKATVAKVELATGKETVLTNIDKMTAFKPKFSPNGKTIAFLAAKEKNGSNDVYLMDADGKNLRIAAETEISEGMFDWSPEGDHLAVSGSINQGDSQLYKLALAKKTLKKISNNKGEDIYFVSISHDGKTIHYDQGSWTTNFFTYASPWNGKSLKPNRVSGQQFLDAQQKILDDYLAPFVGTWEGIATEGRSKGMFKEVATYAWNNKKTALDVTMKFYWGDSPAGEAKGYMAVDRDNLKTYFNLIMQDGTVVMQEQTNTGDPKTLKMDARASGDGSTFPGEFKTELIKLNANAWKSYMHKKVKGEWQRTSVHEFKRIKG